MPSTRHAISALLLAGLCLLAGCAPNVGPPPATALRSTPSPVSTPELPATAIPSAVTVTAPLPGQVAVTVTVAPSAESITVGETISVTVSYQVNNPEQCSYPLYEASLEAAPQEPQLLRFDTPARIGPPGPNPAQFQLTAVAPGQVRLRGRGYGEQDCGGGWQWTYVDGESPLITIAAAP